MPEKKDAQGFSKGLGFRATGLRNHLNIFAYRAPGLNVQDLKNVSPGRL